MKKEGATEKRAARIAAIKAVVVALLVLGASELGLDLTPERVAVIVAMLLGLVWPDVQLIKGRPAKVLANAARGRDYREAVDGPPERPTLPPRP